MSFSISILTSADDAVDGRLHRIANAFIKAGYSVDVHALGSEAAAPVGAHFKRALGKRNFPGRILRDLTLPLIARGDIWIVIAPDLLPTSWLIAKLRGKKIVADVHEDYVQLLKDRAWAKGPKGMAAKFVARLASQLAGISDLTSVADIQVPPFDAKKRLVVRNLPDMSLLTRSTHLNKTPTAIYIGDVRKTRGLFAMLEAAEKAPNWEFEIVGKLSDVDKAAVEKWQATSPAANRVRFHGRLAPHLAWSFASSAWVGLALLDSTPAFVEAVPSKLYEYMGCGLATISTPLPRCIELIEKSQGGKIAHDSSDVAALLNHWEKHPDEIEVIRAKAQLWAEENLDSEAEYGALVAAVNSLKPSIL